MNHRIVLFVLCLTVAAFGPVLGTNLNSSPEDSLHAATVERQKASVQGDTEKIVGFMTDDYIQTDVWGQVQDKATWIREYFNPLAELIRAGKFKWNVYQDKDVQVRVHGDTAIEVGAMVLEGVGARITPEHTWVADPDAHLSGTLRFTRVYIRRNGKWLLAAVHNSMPPSRPAR